MSSNTWGNTDHDERSYYKYRQNKWQTGIDNKPTLSIYSGKPMPKREVFLQWQVTEGVN